MVKFLNATINIFIILLLSVAFVACNDDAVENLLPDNKKNECPLIFNVGTESRSAENISFGEGDRLYFYFKGSAQIIGTATYSSNGKWTLTYDGTLTSGVNGLCNVVYSLNKNLQLDKYAHFSLTSTDALFGTTEGQWEYTNGIMTVYAHLLPLQTKIRFVSNHETEIMIKGIQPQKNFSVKTFAFWEYDDIYRPCYPQSIKLNSKNSDGTFSSSDYYCVGVGTGLFQLFESSTEKGCIHYHQRCEHFQFENNTERRYSPCSLGDYIYIYDRSDILKCYRKTFTDELKKGISLIINVPSQSSHKGWEMIDNQIKVVNGERSGVYINTDINYTCGNSANFSIKKDYYQSGDGLIVSFGGDWVFIKIGQNNNWENYSATSYCDWEDGTLTFIGRSGDASRDPNVYFKNMTYSHFPYYDTLRESWSSYE